MKAKDIGPGQKIRVGGKVLTVVYSVEHGDTITLYCLDGKNQYVTPTVKAEEKIEVVN